MFFRPEEVHRASRVGYAEDPPADGDGDMADQTFGLLRLDLTVFHLDPNGLATIEAHRIDSYRLPRKEPADRQRFKRSLAEPFLLAVNRQAIMRREIVEGGE